VVTNRDYMTDICSLLERELVLKYWNGGIQLQLKTRKERYRSRLNKLYMIVTDIIRIGRSSVIGTNITS